MTIDSASRALTNCALPVALEAVGERWSFMILRASYAGLNHFEEFQSTLGIARNILANRLAKLVDHGILSRSPCTDDRRKIEYRLTEKGQALLPALVALRQWGERWGGCSTPSDYVLVDTREGQPIPELKVCAADGRVLRAEDMRWAERATIGRTDEPIDGALAVK